MKGSPNIAPLQSAYQALHSTETAMIKVVSYLLTAVDSKSSYVLMFMDISTAFDALSDHHRILQRAKVFSVDVPFISKLRVLGVTLDCHFFINDLITSVSRYVTK